MDATGRVLAQLLIRTSHYNSATTDFRDETWRKSRTRESGEEDTHEGMGYEPASTFTDPTMVRIARS
uniref:Transposase n=1 Tax=Steinernema glaseri TaxID=37863 RepID=A0A1I7ZB95_9BILA